MNVSRSKKDLCPAKTNSYFVVSIHKCQLCTYFDVHFCRKYGLEDDTIDFIGHALALHINDSYLEEPAMDFVKRIKVILCFFFYSNLSIASEV